MSGEGPELRFLPLALDFRGRRCLVVGGGVIGTRKALTLAHAGADVTVVSPEVTGTLAAAAADGVLRHVPATFDPSHVEGAFLVVAATDDEPLNEAVAAAAARAGALVCDASSSGRSQAIFGAMLRREDATVAVFTDGRDPAHARRTRDRIAGLLDGRGGASTAAPGSADAVETRRGPASAAAPRPASLLMIGAHVRGGVGPGLGPALEASRSETFALVRKTHRGLRDFLVRVRDEAPACEAFVWNTCQRMELYAWLPDEGGPWARRRLEEDLRRGMFATAPGDLHVGVLHGAPARHHLLRTACGLNSDVPGDRDVVAQLATALRAGECAGTAGARSTALVEDAVETARRVLADTAWGRFAAGYCAAALARVFEVDDVRPDALRHVVVGGSSTSRSVLTALREAHLVGEGRLTAVYRDHHGQMKELRAALGSGRRLRVHGYADGRVLRAMADADVIVFGIDQADPVLDMTVLAGLRDFTVRPLTVVDFNSTGSLGGLAGRRTSEGVRIWSAGDLDQAVAAHVAITTTRRGFAPAVAEAEAWIERHLTTDPWPVPVASPAEGTV
jgi:siroheme synthase-like protein